MALKPPNLEFTRLNSILSLYTPPPSPSPIKPTHPTTILFCAWMGVSPKSRYLNTFLNHYHALYPSARILSIISDPAFFTHTFTSSRTSLFQPVISALDADPAPGRRVLVHVLSNGGVLSFVDACVEYKKITGRVLGAESMVLDSAPGTFEFASAYYAMSMGFPKGALYYPVAALTSVLLGGYIVAKNVFGVDTLVEESRARLNDWELVDRGAKRLYIYSEEDRVVSFDAVEEHANEAKNEGVDVEMVKFERSAHVQHMLNGGERYWGLVEELWGGVKR
ncbi:hypothetical protein BJ875DRAFT_449867 [Amylocarpus encephaloides]|uniref:Indole-diterpene biosynthesis protein PaxU n=1 Tax=Amylocarpus encephaloides TaxID=45428 RepID=A0A9P8CB80_9HELO|nr:hypothetical protein BJ875DRAFT_449867 [Amylocarpus encephaloides]